MKYQVYRNASKMIVGWLNDLFGIKFSFLRSELNDAIFLKLYERNIFSISRF